MFKSKKILSIILCVCLAVTFSFASMNSSVAEEEGTVAFKFSSSKWDWWGCTQGSVNGTWGQNNNALTRNYQDDGTLIYDVVGVNSTGKFQQLQDKWKSLPSGDLYFYFTNNATTSVEIRFDSSAGAQFDQWIEAGATVKISFKSTVASNFSFFAMNYNSLISDGTGLFKISPLYKTREIYRAVDSNPVVSGAATLSTYSQTDKFPKGTLSLVSNAVVNDYVEYTIPSIAAGKYYISVFSRDFTSRCNTDISVNGTKLVENFAFKDFNGLNEHEIGIITLSEQTNVVIRFTATGSGDLYLGHFYVNPVAEGSTTSTTTVPTTTEPTLPMVANSYTPCSISGGWGSSGISTPTYISNKIARSSANVAASQAAQMEVNVANFADLYKTALDEGYENISFDVYAYIHTGSGTTIKATTSAGTLVSDSGVIYYSKGKGVYTVTLPLSTWVPEGKTSEDVTTLKIYAMSYTYGAYAGAVYMSAPYIKDYSPKTQYKIKVDSTTQFVDIPQQGNASFLLPVNNDANFIAYQDENGKFYEAGKSVEVSSDKIFTSFSIELTMSEGASMRFNDPSGMRFYTNIDTDKVAKLRAANIDIKLGTLITMKNLLETDELNLSATYHFIDCKYSANIWYSEGSFTGFVGSLVKIKDSHVNSEFVGRGYATITVGDTVKTIYASYSGNLITNNTRTICWIANKIKTGSEYSSLGDEQKNLVDSFCSKYIA